MSKFSTGLKVAAVAFTFALAGCETPKPPPPPPPAAPAPAPAPAAPTVVPGSLADFQQVVGAADTVHFELDKFAVQDSDKDNLKKQADWLSKYPEVKVQVQGNADERGTREYNLALGARRANSVKEYLVSLGVSAARVETISFGKEKPVCTDSTEDCWAQNRRALTVITSGAK